MFGRSLSDHQTLRRSSKDSTDHLRFTIYLSLLFTIYDSRFTNRHHQRIKTAPHVTPPPNEAIRTMSSFLMRPASTHSSKPIGIDADDVLPCMAMLE